MFQTFFLNSLFMFKKFANLQTTCTKTVIKLFSIITVSISLLGLLAKIKV